MIRVGGQAIDMRRRLLFPTNATHRGQKLRCESPRRRSFGPVLSVLPFGDEAQAVTPSQCSRLRPCRLFMDAAMSGRAHRVAGQMDCRHDLG